MRPFHKKQKVWIIVPALQRFPLSSDKDVIIACTFLGIRDDCKFCDADVYILWDADWEMTINCYSEWGIYSTREEAINDMINGRPKYAIL